METKIKTLRKEKIKIEGGLGFFEEEFQCGVAHPLAVGRLVAESEPNIPLIILTSNINEVIVTDMTRYFANFNSLPWIAVREPNGRTKIIINMKHKFWQQGSPLYTIYLPPMDTFEMEIARLLQKRNSKS